MVKFKYSKRYDPRKLGARCDECPLNAKRLANRVVVPSHVISPAGKRLVILGESPGSTEELEDNFFVGESGKLQDKILDKFAIDRDSIHVTNVLLCRAGKLEPEQLTKAIECCSPRLHREINRDSVVLAYGNVALEALTGKKPKISKHWGPSYKSATYGCQYVSSFHPAWVLRNPHGRVLLELMVQRWIRLSKGYLDFHRPTQIVEPGQDMVNALKKMLAHNGPLAVDNEYIGSSAMTADIICIGLASKELGLSICVPWMTTSDGADTIPEASPIIKILTNEVLASHHLDAHNLQADWLNLKWKAKLMDGPHKDWGDTMLKRRIVSPLLMKSLEDTACTYLTINRWKTEFRGSHEKGGGNLFALANPVKRALYNCDDSWTTALITPLLSRDLAKTHRGPARYKEDLEQTWLAIEMQEHGQGLNRRYIKKHAKDFDGKILRAMERIKLLAGEDFNPASNPQVDKLFTSLGAPSKRRTPTGGRSYNEDALTDIIAKSHNDTACRLAASMLNLRKVEKLAQYVRGGKKAGKIVPLTSFKKGEILRLGWLPYGTITDRWSTDGYPMMMIPQPKKDSKGEERPGLWNCFRPVKVGNYLASADFSAVELRVIALCAGATKLITAFRDYDAGLGPKVHTVNAQNLFGVTNPTPVQYTLAKNFVFGSLYQKHDDRNASRAVWAILVPDFPDIGLADVERLRRDWFKMNPELAEEQERLLAFAEEHRYVDGPLSGNRFQFYGEIDPNKVFNYPVQNTQAELMRRAIIRVRARLIEGEEFIWGQVHDELILEGPNKERLVQILAEELPKPVILRPPFRPALEYINPIEIKVGKNKGQMKKVA